MTLVTFTSCRCCNSSAEFWENANAHFGPTCIAGSVEDEETLADNQQDEATQSEDTDTPLGAALTQLEQRSNAVSHVLA